MKKKHKTGYKAKGTVSDKKYISLGSDSKVQTVLAKAQTIEIKMPDGSTKIIKLPRTSFGGRLVKKGGKIK